MELIYASMLLHKAGKPITEDALSAVLKAAGIEVDSAQIKATVAALKDVDIEEVIKNASVVSPAAAPASEESKEAPKEEKKEEDKGASEEEAAAGLGALFG